MMHLLRKQDVVLRTNDVLPLPGKMMCACGHMKNCEGHGPEHIMAAAGGCIISAQAEHPVCQQGKYIIPIR